jgi:hypothetical protein
MPPTAAVYRFTVWDGNDNVLTPNFATLESIGRAGGTPVDETARTVSRDDLDENGRYPKAKVWLVEIFDIVSRVDGRRRISVPLGEYVMRERSTESYWLTNDDLLPVGFELTLLEISTYLQGKMRILPGNGLSAI